MFVAFALSATDVGETARLTAVGAPSLSVIVSVAVPAVRLRLEGAVPVRTTVSSSSSMVSSVGSKLSVAVPLLDPAAIVTVKALMAA